VTDGAATPLAESWKEFWSLVSPSDESWQAGLARIIKTNLVNHSPNEFHVTPVAEEPHWAAYVEVGCGPKNIICKIEGEKFEFAFAYSRLFIKPYLQEMPRSGPNPLMQLPMLSSDKLPSGCVAQAKLLIADVAIRTGIRIEAIIADALRSGRLLAVGGSPADNFRSRQTLMPMQAQFLGPINLAGSDLRAKSGANLLSAVEVISGEKASGAANKHNFESADILLCREMHAMIKAEDIKIIAAATRVEPRAMRRKGKVENVIQRLQRRYKRARDTGELD
jgi:hypothetical protein